MQLFYLIAFLLGVQCNSAFGEQACYPILGCFSDDPPFNNTMDTLPGSPEQVGTKFLLYTRDRLGSEIIDYVHPQNISNTNFKASRPTKFLIHGYRSSVTDTWVTTMREALLKKEDLNVVEVDWSKGAASVFYPSAAANTRTVAAQVSILIKRLQNVRLDPKDVHLIGHSLGAHISGYVGMRLKSPIGRISGLDPAGPNFEDTALAVRLDASDAVFVDIIHTSGQDMVDGGFGMRRPCGHVDFYPNGGVKQPGCDSNVMGDAVEGFFDLITGEDKLSDDISKVGCSHDRSHDLYIESITSQSCKFTAYPCSSYESFKNGECHTCGPEGCNFAGLRASAEKTGGVQYFLTNSKSPYCISSSTSTSGAKGGSSNLVPFKSSASTSGAKRGSSRLVPFKSDA